VNSEAYNQKVLEELTTIRKEMQSVRKTVEALAKHLNVGGVANGSSAGQNGSSSGSNSRGQVASDSDLDGQHGDPTLRFGLKEKYWSGQDFAGYRLSETSAEFLDAYAKYMDNYGGALENDPDEKKRKTARYKFLDAARARGWAKRLRAGWQPQAVSQTHSNGSSGTSGTDDFGYGSDDEVPF